MSTKEHKSRKVLESTSGIFDGLKILVLPILIGHKRLSLFETQVKKLGGFWCSVKDVKSRKQSVTHIIAEDSLLRDGKSVAKTLQGFEHVDAVVVGTKWLSDCLNKGILLPTEKYCASRSLCDGHVLGSVQQDGSECQSLKKKSKEVESEDLCIPSKKFKGDDGSGPPEEAGPSKDLEIRKYACSQSSSALVEALEGNECIIRELQKLADAFRSKGDTWRTHGYNKAISAIKRCNKAILSYEDALALPDVGSGIASKVWEILESGSLRKVSEICDDEKTRVLECFTAVWGAGPSTAESWYQQGFRTLQDLENKATLTKQQQVGLRHYTDFQERIPRHEVEHVGQLIADVVTSISPYLKTELVGSYRRGKEFCGDIDVMICRPDHLKSQEILSQVLAHLKKSGLITDDLVSVEASGNHRKYLGVCRLPGDGQKFRRLDIFVVPNSELAPATMHYTGSALFNRSIRLLAAKKGMSLSEHSLHAGVVREGLKILNEGYIVPTPTEESIFQALGLDYLPPAERNH